MDTPDQNDVFLLGAGFSRAVSPSMPLLSELTKIVRESMEALHGELGEAWQKQLDSLFHGDIEMWLTYLSQSHPWQTDWENARNRALFIVASREVGDAIQNRTSGVEAQPAPPQWFGDLVGWWHERKSPLVTLNYDTLIERTVLGIPTPEAGSGHPHVYCSDIYPVTLTPSAHRESAWIGGPYAGSFRLFKLHGSANWRYSGSMPFRGQPIYYVPLWGAWGAVEAEEEERYARSVADLVPLIVPPLLEKTPFFDHETIQLLWAGAGEALRAASRIVCMGYSLPPTDITMRFFLRANCPEMRVKLYVVNPDCDAAQRYESLLGDLYEIVQFCCEDPIPQFVPKLLGGGLDTG